MIQGLIDGASGLLSNLGSFFLDIVPAWIREPFKAALGIHSPSRVFAGFGENTMQGYINGIEGMGSKVDRTLSGAVSVPRVPQFDSVSSGVGAAGRSGSAHSGDTFNIFEAVSAQATAMQVQRRQQALAV
jgi:hypothetical protein